MSNLDAASILRTVLEQLPSTINKEQYYQHLRWELFFQYGYALPESVHDLNATPPLDDTLPSLFGNAVLVIICILFLLMFPLQTTPYLGITPRLWHRLSSSHSSSHNSSHNSSQRSSHSSNSSQRSHSYSLIHSWCCWLTTLSRPFHSYNTKGRPLARIFTMMLSMLSMPSTTHFPQRQGVEPSTGILPLPSTTSSTLL